MQVESYGGRGPPRPHAFEQAPQGGIGGIGGGAKWAYSDGREDLGLAEQLEEDSTDVSDFDTSPPPPPPGIGHRRLPSAAAGEAMPPTAMHKRTVQPQATGALSESIDAMSSILMRRRSLSSCSRLPWFRLGYAVLSSRVSFMLRVSFIMSHSW